MSSADLGPVLAERTLVLEPGMTVSIRLGLPFTPDAFPDESWCPYQIIGLDHDGIRHTIGIDAFQALWLALQSLGTRLYASEEYKAGRLHLFKKGDRDLCLPVLEGFSDLLPDWPPPRPEGHGDPDSSQTPGSG